MSVGDGSASIVVLGIGWRALTAPSSTPMVAMPVSSHDDVVRFLHRALVTVQLNRRPGAILLQCRSLKEVHARRVASSTVWGGRLNAATERRPRFDAGTRRYTMIKRLLIILTLGAALAACSPSSSTTSNAPTVAPAASSAPSESAPSAAPSAS